MSSLPHSITERPTFFIARNISSGVCFLKEMEHSPKLLFIAFSYLNV